MIFPRLKWTFLLGFLVRFFLAVNGRTTLESSFQSPGHLQETSSEIPSKEANIKADSDFSCVGRPSGHYADVGSGCTVFYYCDPSGIKSQFKCPRLNLFHQKYNVCDWNFNVKCEESEKYFPNGKGAVNKNIPEFEVSFGPRRKSSQKDSDNSRDVDDELSQKSKSKNSYEDEKEYDEPEEEIKSQKGKLEQPKKDSFRGKQRFEDDNSDEEDNKDNQDDNNYKNDKNNGRPALNFDFQQRATPKQDFGNQFSPPLFRGPFLNGQEVQPNRATFPFQPVKKDFGQRASFSTLIENRQSRQSDEDNEKSEAKLGPSHFTENQKAIQNAQFLDLNSNWDDEDRLRPGFITVDEKIRRPAAQRDFRQGFADDSDGLSHGHHSDEDDNGDEGQRNGPRNEAFRNVQRDGFHQSDNVNLQQFSQTFDRDDSHDPSFEKRREFNDFSNGEGHSRGEAFQGQNDNNQREFDGLGEQHDTNRKFFDGGRQDEVQFRGGRARNDDDGVFSNTKDVPFNSFNESPRSLSKII